MRLSAIAVRLSGAMIMISLLDTITASMEKLIKEDIRTMPTDAPKKWNEPIEKHSLVNKNHSKIGHPVREVVERWSAWSVWTPCSRKCGGGVTHQNRHCIKKPLNSKYRMANKRQESKRSHCVGLYMRTRLCNTQECPEDSPLHGTDFRSEQCAAFNFRPFRGKQYQWVPFKTGKDECALNCRPKSQNFYATLNRTVIDGTACERPKTSWGKLAPKNTKGVCIAGVCKSVNSNGIVGSIDDNNPELCAPCKKGICRTINGIYTRPDVPQGYSLVAQLPQNACMIRVEQLKPTKNFIALRNSYNGSFVINGQWKRESTRIVESAGTKFHYHAGDSSTPEHLKTVGPITEPLDILLVNFQINSGIKYSYTLPSLTISNASSVAPPLIKPPEARKLEVRPLKDESHSLAHHRRLRQRRRYVWKVSGVTACSKPCGGGIQAAVFSCVREMSMVSVSERRCSHIEKPPPQLTKCNLHACIYENRNADNSNVIEKSEWVIGAWSACSSTCGPGHRIRSVTCPSGTCPADERPKHREYCHNTCPSTNPWLLSDWSSCSKLCGTGVQTRIAICVAGLSNNCTEKNKPDVRRACSSDKQCGGQWFTGPWSSCDPQSCTTNGTSGDPKHATRKRDVVCVVKMRGQLHIGNDMTCNAAVRPEHEQDCTDKCELFQWFMGEWGPCDYCDENRIGMQRRDVHCLDRHGQRGLNCNSSDMPITKRTCTCKRTTMNTNNSSDELEMAQSKNRPVQDQPDDKSCVDSMDKCQLAVQARLCKYRYFANTCCASCPKSAAHQLLTTESST